MVCILFFLLLFTIFQLVVKQASTAFFGIYWDLQPQNIVYFVYTHIYICIYIFLILNTLGYILYNLVIGHVYLICILILLLVATVWCEEPENISEEDEIRRPPTRRPVCREPSERVHAAALPGGLRRPLHGKQARQQEGKVRLWSSCEDPGSVPLQWHVHVTMQITQCTPCSTISQKTLLFLAAHVNCCHTAFTPQPRRKSCPNPRSWQAVGWKHFTCQQLHTFFLNDLIVNIVINYKKEEIDL